MRRSPGFHLIFKSGDVRAEATNAAGVSTDGESTSLQVAGISVPYENVAWLNAGLLQPFRDGESKHSMRRNAFATEPVGFQSDYLVFSAALEDDVLPCIHGPLASGVGCDGAVKKFADPLFVESSIGSVQGRVARDDNLCFPSLGLVVQRPQSKSCSLLRGRLLPWLRPSEIRDGFSLLSSHSCSRPSGRVGLKVCLYTVRQCHQRLRSGS